jgi:hypothetical protein
MLYVSFMTWKPGLTQEQRQGTLARRAAYQFPSGYKWVAEYWPAGPTTVVSAFEADSYAPIMQVVMDWQDAFDFAIYPATTAEEGLKIGAQILQQAAAQ